MTQTKNPHVLETESIGKLLIQYSIPAIIAMTVTSVYNIVDSIFIGHGVGPLAISGLALTFPLSVHSSVSVALRSVLFTWDRRMI